MIKIVLLALGIASVTLGLGAAAKPPCDPDLMAVEGTQGYQPRQGALCDGLSVSRVGAPPIEIVCVIRGGSLMGIAPAKLYLSIAAKPSVGQLHLRAIGIPYRLYYRLDALVEPNQTIIWFPWRVLGPINVPLEQIGIFGYGIDASGVPFYVPVRVRTTPAEAEPKTPEPTIVALRAAPLSEDIQWRFMPAGGLETPGTA